MRDGRLFGSVRLPGHNVQIRPTVAGRHTVFEIDPSRLEENRDDFIPVSSDPGSALPAPPFSGASPIIDVLVVYTPATLADVGGVEAMDALIDLAEVETNTSYANSDVSQRLRIVHAEEIAYVESGSLGTTATSTPTSRIRRRAGAR